MPDPPYDTVKNIIHTAEYGDLVAFRDALTKNVAKGPATDAFYSFDRAASWFMPEVFANFISGRSLDVPILHSPPSTPAALAPATPKRPSSPSEPPGPSKAPKSPRILDPSRIKITEKVNVQHVIHLTAIPKTWPVPRDGDTAYLLDLTGTPRPLNKDGGPVTMQSWIRHDDQESWLSGCGGKANGATPVYGLHPDRTVACRRIDLSCRGLKTCQFVDHSVFEGFQRYESDSSLMLEHANGVRQQRREESSSTVLLTVSFFNFLHTSRKYKKCKKKDCPGYFIVKQLKQGSDERGNRHFVGCTLWDEEDRGHRFAPWNHGADPRILTYMFEHNGALPTYQEPRKICYSLMHPRQTTSTCALPHIENNHAIRGGITWRECPTRMIMYAPTDPNISKIYIILRKPHSHPNHPPSKPSLIAQSLWAEAVLASGVIGATAAKVANAQSTQAIIGATSVAGLDVGLLDKRAQTRIVKQKKTEILPNGTGFAGVFALQQQEARVDFDPTERYVHEVHQFGDFCMVVTMDAFLATLLHEVTYLVLDFTFKRVFGDVNEYEIVVWDMGLLKRVTVARLYSDGKTRHTFRLLYQAFERTVEKVTGKPLQYTAFHPHGNIRTILLDAEAAQIQGIGDCLLTHNNPALTGIDHPTAEEIVQWIVKMCIEHFKRGVQVIKNVSDKEREYLRSFPYLTTDDAITKFHDFCSTHNNDHIYNWHHNKAPWFWAGLNPLVSKMSSDCWNTTPLHTNLVETGHAATNYATGIGLTLLEAIQSARAYDKRMSDEIQARLAHGLNSTASVRGIMASNTSRREGRHHRAEVSKQQKTELEEATHAKKVAAEAKKAAEARIKELKGKKPSATSSRPSSSRPSSTRPSAARAPSGSSKTPSLTHPNPLPMRAPPPQGHLRLPGLPPHARPTESVPTGSLVRHSSSPVYHPQHWPAPNPPNPRSYAYPGTPHNLANTGFLGFPPGLSSPHALAMAFPSHSGLGLVIPPAPTHALSNRSYDLPLDLLPPSANCAPHGADASGVFYANVNSTTSSSSTSWIPPTPLPPWSGRLFDD